MNVYILRIFTFSGAFLFLYLWSYCSENWTVHMNLNLKHILFLLFFEIPNLTKCILVLQQLHRNERINTLRIFHL